MEDEKELTQNIDEFTEAIKAAARKLALFEAAYDADTQVDRMVEEGYSEDGIEAMRAHAASLRAKASEG